jgi:hypothetical protein
MRTAFCCLFAISLAVQAQGPRQGWWVTEPVRWLQTNVREIDATIDAKAFVAEATRMNANVLHYNMGGISANYHPQVPSISPAASSPPATTFSATSCAKPTPARSASSAASTSARPARRSTTPTQNGSS